MMKRRDRGDRRVLRLMHNLCIASIKEIQQSVGST